MQVTCSNCGARYIVDPLAIGPTGRTVQCARCNNRWFERAGPASSAVLRERVEQPEPDVQDTAERAQGQAPPQPAYRSGLPALTRPQPRRLRWPLWIAAAVLLVVALGAVLVFRGDVGSKSPMPWRATGLSVDVLKSLLVSSAEARPTAVPKEARVDILPTIE